MDRVGMVEYRPEHAFLQTTPHLSLYFKMNHQQYVYLDNSAATAVDSRVLEAMEPYLQGYIANAGALHAQGVQVHTVIEASRKTVAQVLEAHPDEIVFTSGGTESNNLAIQGVVRALRIAGKRPEDIHLVTTTVEHSSVHDCFQALKQDGVQISIVPVDADGFVQLDALVGALRAETALVSVIYAHNEIGTIERVADITRSVRRFNEKNGTSILVHTDASQAPAWIPCEVTKLGVDLMTLDAQKLYGPKGVGCLYHARGIHIAPILYGGGQEHGLRPGTPPTPLIVGFAKALQLVETERASYLEAVTHLRDICITEVISSVPGVVVNGPQGRERIAGNINFSFPGLDGEQVVLELDARGVAVSTRSACLTSSAPGSYTVRALGKGDACAQGAVRLSLSRHTTKEEMEYATRMLIEVVQWLTGTRD
jgi:cysteine desulfurase